mgnify:CR=1 FL=1
MEKKWYESRTLWFNVLGLILVVLEYIGTINVIDPQIIATGLAMGNGLLRFRTNEGLKL